ncbi:MAG TPA: DNA-binding response regulator [Propionibacteriaceae bacterium]|nr:DNA-binding response regulator [Propionibacteriaceae bacterium]
MIRVVLGDDNLRQRRMLRQHLEQSGDIVVVGEAGTHEAVQLLARNRRPHVVLTDVLLAGKPGLATIRALTAPQPTRAVSVMVLTSHRNHARAIDALDCGAMAFLTRPINNADLASFVRAAAAGQVLLSATVTTAIRAELVARGAMLWGDRDPITDLLTTTELSVVALLCSGLTTNEAIAEQHHVSVNTVRSQLQRCLRKTGLSDRTQLALWGVRHGLGQPSRPTPPLSPDLLVLPDSG